MHRAAFILAAIWAATGYAQAEDFAPVPNQLLHCTAPAFQGDNNDIRIRPEDRQRGKRVSLPDAVADAMNVSTGWVTMVYRDKSYWEGDRASYQADLDAMKCSDVYPVVNVVNLRDGLMLYAVHAQTWATNWLLLIVYDPVTGKATKKPASVNTRAKTQ